MSSPSPRRPQQRDALGDAHLGQHGQWRLEPRHLPRGPVAVAAEPSQRTRRRETAQLAPVELRQLGHLLHAVEPALAPCPRRHEPLGRLLWQSLDQAQAEAQRGTVGALDALERAVPVAREYVDRSHRHTVALRVLHEL